MDKISEPLTVTVPPVTAYESPEAAISAAKQSNASRLAVTGIQSVVGQVVTSVDYDLQRFICHLEDGQALVVSANPESCDVKALVHKQADKFMASISAEPLCLRLARQSVLVMGSVRVNNFETVRH